jgi:hypothetical protein
MRDHNRILVLFAVLSTCLSAYEMPVGRMQDDTGKLSVVRDKGKENDVAKLFETARSDAKLPPLARIGHRDSLEQLVCTMANSGTFQNRHSGGRVAFYITANPESISPELITIASFKEHPTRDKLAYPRYSVAVWQRKDTHTGETTYWVGLELAWSALEEFVDYHFTDDVFYHDQWKKNVAPQCRGK